MEKLYDLKAHVKPYMILVFMYGENSRLRKLIKTKMYSKVTTRDVVNCIVFIVAENAWLSVLPSDRRSLRHRKVYLSSSTRIRYKSCCYCFPRKFGRNKSCPYKKYFTYIFLFSRTAFIQLRLVMNKYME